MTYSLTKHLLFKVEMFNVKKVFINTSFLFFLAHYSDILILISEGINTAEK